MIKIIYFIDFILVCSIDEHVPHSCCAVHFYCFGLSFSTKFLFSVLRFTFSFFRSEIPTLPRRDRSFFIHMGNLDFTRSICHGMGLGYSGTLGSKPRGKYSMLFWKTVSRISLLPRFSLSLLFLSFIPFKVWATGKLGLKINTQVGMLRERRKTRFQQTD